MERGLGEIMANPFEDESASYVVLANQEEQYSLWPAGKDVPSGWITVLQANTRQACLDFVNCTWTDMRPKTLKERMSPEKSH